MSQERSLLPRGLKHVELCRQSRWLWLKMKPCSCPHHHVPKGGWTRLLREGPCRGPALSTQREIVAPASVEELQLLSVELHLAFYLTCSDLCHNLWQVFNASTSLYQSSQSHMQPIRSRHSLLTIILHRHSSKLSAREGGSAMSLSSGEHADCAAEMSQRGKHIPE